METFGVGAPYNRYGGGRGSGRGRGGRGGGGDRGGGSWRGGGRGGAQTGNNQQHYRSRERPEGSGPAQWRTAPPLDDTPDLRQLSLSEKPAATGSS